MRYYEWHKGELQYKYQATERHSQQREHELIIKSKVCPWTWVDPETCCVRLKESIISKKSLASALEEQHTCTFKSPTIKNESYFKQISPTKSENFCIIITVHTFCGITAWWFSRMSRLIWWAHNFFSSTVLA